jgi:low temperature requirement protein LtrA
MSARDSSEKHRVSSPIELLFDLTFVVAIAQVAEQLARSVADGRGGAAIVPFVMVFFAIWWAWMNFTWFASAYDTDDVPYRVMTLVQMGGVLVLAAGVPLAFEHQDFLLITLGYFIMRIGLVAQWIRAAVANPAARATAVRYAVIISAVQMLWLVRQALPATPDVVLFTVYLPFAVLVVLELLTPILAEKTGGTSWHPHHIAKRYGLFTIILLGESIAALASSVRLVIGDGEATGALVTVGVCSLVVVFALWWLYFMPPSGDGLEKHRSRSFAWGFLHYFVFVALAALGGGLQVVNEAAVGHGVLPAVAAFAAGIPIAVYLLAFWATQRLILPLNVVPFAGILPASVALLLLPLTAANIGLPACYLLMTLVVVALLAVIVVRADRHVRELAAAESASEGAIL